MLSWRETTTFFILYSSLSFNNINLFPLSLLRGPKLHFFFLLLIVFQAFSASCLTINESTFVYINGWSFSYRPKNMFNCIFPASRKRSNYIGLDIIYLINLIANNAVSWEYKFINNSQLQQYYSFSNLHHLLLSERLQILSLNIQSLLT